MADKYGYRHGHRVIVRLPVDSSTSAIESGDMVSLATAGYVKQLVAGDLVKGVSLDDCPVPAADGDAYIDVDISRESVYEYPPDAGTVTAGLVMKTCDTGGARSVNIDATVNDDLEIVQVDVDANSIYVRLRPTYSGV